MPKIKRMPLVTTRLSMTDTERLDKYCLESGRTKSDIARLALLEFLDANPNQEIVQHDSILERRLKKMEDRLAALLVRNAIDTGIVYHFLWQNSNKETRAKLFDNLYASTISRLKKKLPKVESEVKEMMKEPEQ